MTQKEWVDLISPIAQKVCNEYGYLASVLTAQTCQETGYGTTTLVPQHNIIGMKVDLLNSSWDDKTVWDGRVFRKETIEFTSSGKKYTKEDNFRVYDSYEQCLTDYLMFMRYGANGRGCTPKYGDLMTETNPEKLITAVAGRGYCTDPGYPKAIMTIIDKWRLRELDKPIEAKGEHISALAPRKIIDITSKNKAPGPRSEKKKIEWIVVHYLGVPNADNPYIYGGGYGGHYNVQRNGEIYKAVDPKKGVVWHCGGKNGAIQGESKDSDGVAPHRYHGKCYNANSIGIECGVCFAGTDKSPSGTDGRWYFTTETQASLVYLVSTLMDEYGIDIDHVIRHFDVSGKCCPNPYVLNNNYQSSWTWKQFRANLTQYRKEGTITLPEGGKVIVDTQKPTTGGCYMYEVETVRRGSRGASVKHLQTLLKGNDYKNIDGTPLKLDGDAGTNTVNAIVKYQKDHGLDPDGIAGAKTWGKIIGL